MKLFRRTRAARGHRRHLAGTALHVALLLAVVAAPFVVYRATRSSAVAEGPSWPDNIAVSVENRADGSLRGIVLLNQRRSGAVLAVRMPATAQLQNGRGRPMTGSELYDLGGASFVAEGLSAALSVGVPFFATVSAQEEAVPDTFQRAADAAATSVPDPLPSRPTDEQRSRFEAEQAKINQERRRSQAALSNAQAFAWQPTVAIQENNLAGNLGDVVRTLVSIRDRDLLTIKAPGHWEDLGTRQFVMDGDAMLDLITTGALPSPSLSPSPVALATVPPEDVTVEVLNAGGPSGAANDVAELLRDEGFEISRVATFSGDPIRGVRVYYLNAKAMGTMVANAIEAADGRSALLPPDFETEADVLVLVGGGVEA